MICDVCGRDNAEHLKFCADCGKKFAAPARPATPGTSAPPSVASAAHAPGPVATAAAAAFAAAAPPGTPPAGVSRASSPGSEAGTGRRSHRPEAPAFNFAPTPPARQEGHCPTCGHVNPPTFRFCAVCGSTVGNKPPARAVSTEEPKLVPAPVLAITDAEEAKPEVVTCARCRGQCAKGARFCKYCGAPLSAGESVAPRDVAARPESFPAPDTTSAPPPQHVDSVRVGARVEPARVVNASPTFVARRVDDDVAPVSVAPLVAPEPIPAPAPAPVSAAPAPVPVAQAPVAQAPVAPPIAPTVVASGPASASAASPAAQSAPQSVPQPRSASAPSAARQVLGKLVVLVEDGSEGKTYELAERQVDIGRSEGDILLFDDAYVSPRHARLFFGDSGWAVRDLGSVNGVYARIRGRHVLQDGDLILLGLQVLQFQSVPESEQKVGFAVQHGTRVFGSKPVTRLARLIQRTTEGLGGDVVHLFRDETVIGREVGDLVFTHDPFLSRKHASLRQEPSGSATRPTFVLEDLGSSNGTYIAIRNDHPLGHTDRIRVGQHLFRLDVPGEAGDAGERKEADR